MWFTLSCSTCRAYGLFFESGPISRAGLYAVMVARVDTDNPSIGAQVLYKLITEDTDICRNRARGNPTIHVIREGVQQSGNAAPYCPRFTMQARILRAYVSSNA